MLEKYPDFHRDFRGDTIHASTLQVLDELGLMPAFDRLPHQPTRTVAMMTDDGMVTLGDFTRLPGAFQYLSMVPQWDFLALLTAEAAKYPTFTLLRPAEVTDLIVDRDVVCGVRYRVRRRLARAASHPDGRLRRAPFRGPGRGRSDRQGVRRPAGRAVVPDSQGDRRSRRLLRPARSRPAVPGHRPRVLLAGRGHHAEGQLRIAPIGRDRGLPRRSAPVAAVPRRPDRLRGAKLGRHRFPRGAGEPAPPVAPTRSVVHRRRRPRDVPDRRGRDQPGHPGRGRRGQPAGRRAAARHRHRRPSWPRSSAAGPCRPSSPSGSSC